MDHELVIKGYIDGRLSRYDHGLCECLHEAELGNYEFGYLWGLQVTVGKEDGWFQVTPELIKKAELPFSRFF